MVHLGPGQHFVGEDEQLFLGPIGIELVFERFLPQYPEIRPEYLAVCLEKAAFAGALRAMHDDGGVHLGAAVLDRVGQPAQYPPVDLAVVLLVAAQVFQQLQQHGAGAGLGHGRPARPEQVAAHRLVGFARVEADFGVARHPPVGVILELVPSMPRQQVDHVLFVHQAPLGFIEQHVAAQPVGAPIALRRVINRDARRHPFPAPLGRDNPSQHEGRIAAHLRHRGLDLHPHRLGAVEHGQVVEVGEFPASPVADELGLDPRPAHRERGRLGGLAAGVAVGEVVVVGAQQDARALISFLDGLGYRLQVAGVERHHHRQAGRLVQRGGGGVALGDQHDVADDADGVEAALFRQSAREVFLLQLVAAILAADDLQPPHPASAIAHRDGERAIGRRRPAQAMRGHALAGQVVALAIAGNVLAPHHRRLGRGPLGFALAFGLGLLAVVGQALFQRRGLLGRQRPALDLDLLRVAVVALPHAIRADDDLPAFVVGDLMQPIPAAILAVAVHHLAAHRPVIPDQQPRRRWPSPSQIQPEALELLHHAVVVGHRAVLSAAVKAALNIELKSRSTMRRPRAGRSNSLRYPGARMNRNTGMTALLPDRAMRR